MNQLIACCGLDCETCDARIATLTDNNALREKTAALWTKLNGVAIAPEMIHCTGCRIDGVKTPFCDSLCIVRNCADCEQMEKCQTLGRITVNNPLALENLKQLCRLKQADEEAAAASRTASATLNRRYGSLSCCSRATIRS